MHLLSSRNSPRCTQYVATMLDIYMAVSTVRRRFASWVFSMLTSSVSVLGYDSSLYGEKSDQRDATHAAGKGASSQFVCRGNNECLAVGSNSAFIDLTLACSVYCILRRDVSRLGRRTNFVPPRYCPVVFPKNVYRTSRKAKLMLQVSATCCCHERVRVILLR